MLQVVTANIGGHRNYRELAIDPISVAKELKANLQLDFQRPTILALQEVIKIAFEPGKIWDIGEELAKELGEGYQAFFAPKINSASYPHITAWEKASYAGAIYAAEGNGIVTNLPLQQWPWPIPAANFPGHGVKSPIIVNIGTPHLYSTGNRDTEPRNLIIASLLADSKPIYCISTHLSTIKGEDRHNPEAALSQEAAQKRSLEVQHILGILQELREAERNYGHSAAPVILAGDFNVNMEREEMKLLQSQFSNLALSNPNGAYTHVKHKTEIDHILLNDPLAVLSKPKNVYLLDKLPSSNFLDHLPKVVLFD